MRYVITSYIPDSTTHKDCYKTLLNYCQHNGIDSPIILPSKANYVDEQYNLPEDFLPSEGGLFLNKNLYIPNLYVNHNLVDPIAGLDAIAAEMGSLIIAAPRHRFKSVARSLKHSKTPHGIWCTGSISNPSYKETKQGMAMQNYHILGAIVVTIQNDDIFHIRQLEYSEEHKCICDLNKCYKLNGEVTEIRPSISLGDLHPPFVNPDILAKTCVLLSDLNVKDVVYHDAFDFAQAGSHHLEGKFLTKAFASSKIKTIQDEVKLTAKTLNYISSFTKEDCKHYIVASNHNEHLDRYLDSFKWREDTPNLLYALELVTEKVRFKQGLSNMDSLEYGLFNEGLNDSFIFLQRKDKVSIHGQEISNHGDFGANGAKSSGRTTGLAFTSGNVITGHSHSAEIGIYGNYVNGTMTHLSMPYTNDSGTSSWLHTHTLIYPNGKRSHIHLIED